jgi:hypothetical protein
LEGELVESAALRRRDLAVREHSVKQVEVFVGAV